MTGERSTVEQSTCVCGDNKTAGGRGELTMDGGMEWSGVDVSDQLLYTHITHIYVSITVRQTKKGGMGRKKVLRSGPIFIYVCIRLCVLIRRRMNDDAFYLQF